MKKKILFDFKSCELSPNKKKAKIVKGGSGGMGTYLGMDITWLGNGDRCDAFSDDLGREVCNMRIVLYFFVIIFLFQSCIAAKDNYSKLTCNTVELEGTGYMKDIFPYDVKKYNKEYKLRYGEVKIDTLVFRFGIYDANKNGNFGDIREDFIFVGDKDDTLFSIQPQVSSAVSTLKISNLIRFNNRYFRLTTLENQHFCVEEVKQPKTLDLNFTNLLPDIILDETLGSSKVSLHNFIGEKPIKLVFWAPWCRPCIQEMAHFWEKKAYSNYTMIFVLVPKDTILSEEDIDTAANYIKKNGYGKFIFLNEGYSLSKLVNQNGVPWGSI